MNDSVDILLATYQGSSYIEEQLQSLFNQDYPFFHLIIRDDGSTDETLSIIDKFSKHHKNRITVLSHSKKLGVLGNFSELIKCSTADYALFCDQDDIWAPHKIKVSLERIKQMESCYGKQIPLLAHTDLQVVKSDLSLINSSFWKYANLNPHLTELNRLLVQNVATGCTMIANRALLELAYPIPNDCPMHDWWLTLVAKVFGHIEVISEKTVLYRQHGHTTTGEKKYNLLRFLKTRLSNNYKNSIPLIYAQAKEFLRRYGSQLDPHSKKTIEIFCNLKDLPSLKRKKTILNHQFLKQGLLRNLFLLSNL